ncbi:MAG: glycerol-3-phosphate 1-O-acyltransferase PlsY [Rickettsiales bacterium]|jgi:glycerol-3-phosphate acyltransferase PlsY|nr:glycerol-3-phosphate 1-O-acyltransferase PlsY [Rickettsiales bacterium]
MMAIFQQFLFLVATYFIASIPFGLILTKFFTGKDIRKLGSKNIGATNVTRIAGKRLGFATLVLDCSKGAIMVIIARFNFYQISHFHLFLTLVSFIAVMAHIYPIYLNFKGGKGVATTLATLIALDFTAGLLALCFWTLTFSITRISAISSLIAIFSSIIFSKFYNAPIEQIALCTILFIITTVKHKENIIRILNKEESKF